MKAIPLTLTEAQVDTILTALFSGDQAALAAALKSVEKQFDETITKLDKTIDDARLSALHKLRFKLRATLRVLAPDTTLIHNYGTANKAADWKAYENIVIKAGRDEACRIFNSIVDDVPWSIFSDDMVAKAVDALMSNTADALNVNKSDYLTGNARRVAATALRSAIVLVENEIEELLPVVPEVKLTGEFEACSTQAAPETFDEAIRAARQSSGGAPRFGESPSDTAAIKRGTDMHSLLNRLARRRQSA